MTPPNGYVEVIKTFGDLHEPMFEGQNIDRLDLPYPLLYGTAMVTHTRCHRLLVPVFQAVFQAIKDAGLSDKAAHFSGIYAQRGIRAFPQHPSLHCWGVAIDLNAEDNPLGATKSKQDPRMVGIFKDHGFMWGFEFHNRKDPMHFQFATGC
jgi:hypothetical protein